MPETLRAKQRWKRTGVFAQLTATDQAAVLKRMKGVCHLCDDVLDLEGQNVAADHLEAGGPTNAANIYLAHSICNSFRGDLNVDVARKLVRFWKYLRQHRNAKLNEVLAFYPGGSTERRLAMSMDLAKQTVTLKFEGRQVTAPIFVDPATKWQYFYADVPASYLANDQKVQPRTIKFAHVQKLFKDFVVHPVHEPPACRLTKDGNRYRLLMFDGQHKTAAQLALKRPDIHVKVYVEPSVAEVNRLVKVIQSTITKLPLSPGAFSKKMKELHRLMWEDFLERVGRDASEAKFVASFHTRPERQAAEQDLIEALVSEVWDPEESEPSKFIPFVEDQSPLPDTRYALKQASFRTKLLKPLIYTKPLDLVDPEQQARVEEAQNVRRLLDIVADLALTDKWITSKDEATTSEHRVSERFFNQGSMLGWVDLLKKVIVNVCDADPDDKDRPLLRKINPAQWRRISDSVKRIYQHPLWGSDDVDVIRAINQNKLSASQELLRTNSLTFEYALTGSTS